MLERVPAPIRERLWSLKHTAVKWMTKNGFADSLHVLLEAQLGAIRATHVLDVGANRGQYGRLMRRLGFEGRIISFEPVQQCFDELALFARRDGNWDAHRLALGATDGTLTINVTKDDVFSSLLNPSIKGRRMFADGSAVQRKEEVPVRRLATLLPDLVPRAFWATTHLKTDTQGSDAAVLDGLDDLLDEIPSLQIEVSLIGIYEAQCDYLEMLSPLHKRGFRLTGLFPITRDGEFRIIEADAVLRSTGRQD